MELLNAVKNNDNDTFKKLIKVASSAATGGGGNTAGLPFDALNAMDSDNNTPLLLASQLGNVKMVKALLSKGADANLANNLGKTAISYAAQKGSTDIVKTLLKSGADPNLKDAHGNTPLLEAIKAGVSSTLTGGQSGGGVGKSMMDGVVKTLLKGGADVNSTDAQGNSPLTIAAKGGALDTVKMLCVKGADLFKADSMGKTPLQYAQEGNYGEVVKIIGGLSEGTLNIKSLMSGAGGNMLSNLTGGGGESLLKKCTII
ncbi:unnamed protein product [Gordionus sp. m RMFG-2023]|uniref:26S proteasome non-ATPase regulatory subunit 10-like n=1 Tax=Gordionus sp. m RMFG-2023 TaxID=3053472 RepID=UPI0030E5A99E